MCTLVVAQAVPSRADNATGKVDSLRVASPITIRSTLDTRLVTSGDHSAFVATWDLSQQRDRVLDLPFVLSQIVGVRVRQYGGLDAFATASIRGSSSSQVNVYVDGVPTNDPYLGVTNLADLPIGAVERVDVYRGFSPVHLGASAIGGSINLVTIDPSRHQSGALFDGADAIVSYGSFESAQQLFTTHFSPHNLRVKLHASHRRTAGDFTYRDDNGTPDNPDDDTTTVRANNDSDTFSAAASVSGDVGDTVSLTGAIDYVDRESGVPGIGSNPSLSARAGRERGLAHFLARTVPLWDQLTADVRGFYSRTHDRYTDRTADVSLAPQDVNNQIDVYGGRLHGRWHVPRIPLALDVAFDGRKEMYQPTRYIPTTVDGPDQWRRNQAWTGSVEGYLLDSRIVLSATQRWEQWSAEYYAPPRFPWLPPTPSGRVSNSTRAPSTGIRVQPWQFIAIKANLGEYYRLPTFMEMFGNSGSVTGNPALLPESGLNRDIGVVLTRAQVGFIRAAYFEAVWLENESEDLILFFPNSQYTVHPVNIGAARIRGWEFVGRANFGGRLDAALNYTRLDAQDTGDIPYYNGNQLPSRPRGDLNVSLSTPWRQWRLTWEYQHLESNFIDRANLTSVPARDTHSLILGWRLPVAGLAFSLEGRNLTDNQISDISGFPLPGRSVFASLRYDTSDRRSTK